MSVMIDLMEHGLLPDAVIRRGSFSLCLLANSTIRMPFLDICPTGVTSPTWE